MGESGIIYVTINIVTGKRYVGIHTRGVKSYIGSGKYFKLAVAKHGKKNFRRIDVEKFDSVDAGLAMEREWIKGMNSKWPMGYNLNDGGRGNLNPTEETRMKIGCGWRGKHLPDYMKDNLRRIRTGTTLSPEHRAKIGEGLKGRAVTAMATAARVAAWRGCHHTEAAKNKMRNAAMGRHHTPESRAKMSISQMGRHHPEEVKQKIRDGVRRKCAERKLNNQLRKTCRENNLFP
jgi:hypothetical protein